MEMEENQITVSELPKLTKAMEELSNINKNNTNIVLLQKYFNM